MKQETGERDMDKFKGFDYPEQNWTKLPNSFLDLEFASLSEMKVVLYVLRHTWGFQEFAQPKRITLDEFENGRKRRDQTRLDKGVGMARSSVRRGIAQAVEHGYLQRERETNRDKARQAYLYSLAMTSENSPPMALKGSELAPLKGAKRAPIGRTMTPRSEKETIERNTHRKMCDLEFPTSLLQEAGIGEPNCNIEMEIEEARQVLAWAQRCPDVGAGWWVGLIKAGVELYAPDKTEVSPERWWHGLLPAERTEQETQRQERQPIRSIVV